MIVTHVLLDRNVLDMIIVLLFTTEGKLRTFIQLIGIAFSRDIHHDEIFSHLVKLTILALRSICLLCFLSVHTHITIVSRNSNHTTCVNARSSNSESH